METIYRREMIPSSLRKIFRNVRGQRKKDKWTGSRIRVARKK